MNHMKHLLNYSAEGKQLFEIENEEYLKDFDFNDNIINSIKHLKYVELLDKLQVIHSKLNDFQNDLFKMNE